jgi:phosphatidylglycerophosphate synthase
MAESDPARLEAGGGAFKARPAELEDGLNRFVYHPLSRRLALVLQHTPVTPNMVSVVSGLAIVAASAAYTLISWPAAVAAGLVFHLLWHIADGADGDLARLTGRTSPMGEAIDGAADYLGHVILYTALTFWAGGWCWVVTPIAAASRILQANHIESVRRTYAWRAYGLPWLGRTKAARGATIEGRGPLTRVFGAVADGYVALAAFLVPRGEQADALIEAAERDPQRLERARRVSRQIGVRALGLQAWLGPNRRTLVLGLSMAAGSPLWFFLFEATLLNLVLIASIRLQWRVNSELAEALEREARTA